MNFSLEKNKNGTSTLGFHMHGRRLSDFELDELELQCLWHLLEEWLEEDGISAPMEAHQLERDKDGFLVGEVSDLSEYLPFLIHDSESDTLEEIIDGDSLVDWSSDIDTKPQYDKIYSKR